MIELIELQKKYNGHVIINCRDFVFNHPITWLYGANGSGKTTLLKIIAGMIPFEGTIQAEGVDLQKKPVAYRKLVSYAAAEPLFPPSLSGKDLLRFVSTARKSSVEHEKQLIADFGMAEYVANPVGSYSSGMVKKLSLAMAFIGNARWLLLDEPLITLDQMTQGILIQKIYDRLQSGTKVILTSHQALISNVLGPIQTATISHAVLHYDV